MGKDGKSRRTLLAYTIPAVEVLYKGILFRSRLEARWAAFFDLCRWKWVYEPVDFNGWFPDFVLIGKRGNQVYVEVKPITELDVDLQDRIDASGCTDECLIVGLCPTHPSGSWQDAPLLGWLREDDCWSDAICCKSVPGMRSPFCLDFHHSDFSWRPRMLGQYGNNAELLHDVCCNAAELWGLAHEMTRYDPF